MCIYVYIYTHIHIHTRVHIRASRRKPLIPQPVRLPDSHMRGDRRSVPNVPQSAQLQQQAGLANAAPGPRTPALSSLISHVMQSAGPECTRAGPKCTNAAPECTSAEPECTSAGSAEPFHASAFCFFCRSLAE